MLVEAKGPERPRSTGEKKKEVAETTNKLLVLPVQLVKKRQPANKEEIEQNIGKNAQNGKPKT